MWFNRHYQNSESFFKKGKVTVFYGARRVGKTSLINKMLEGASGNIYRGVGDDRNLQDIFVRPTRTSILTVFKGFDIVYIDEAQEIPNIGLGMKILIDESPELIVIITGSSSFNLAGEIGEPLTGRQFIYPLYPISVLELVQDIGGMSVIERLDDLLIYGSYPEVLLAQNKNEKIKYLTNLRDSYLLKDILMLDGIKNSSVIFGLLKSIAYQIGHEVSLNELSRTHGIAKQTVAKYLDLLEKTFVLKKVGGFSRNLRKEVTKSNRYYFYDIGVRNAIINNFNPIENRNDIGMLWENFLFMERMKKQSYLPIHANNYFWRTYDQKEIDLVEERDGRLFGFEFKYKNKKAKAPKLWLKTYKEADWTLITKNNFLEFVS